MSMKTCDFANVQSIIDFINYSKGTLQQEQMWDYDLSKWLERIYKSEKPCIACLNYY